MIDAIDRACTHGAHNEHICRCSLLSWTFHESRGVLGMPGPCAKAGSKGLRERLRRLYVDPWPFHCCALHLKAG